PDVRAAAVGPWLVVQHALAAGDAPRDRVALQVYLEAVLALEERRVPPLRDRLAVVALARDRVPALVAPARVVGDAARIAQEVLALAFAEALPRLVRAALHLEVGGRRG